MVGSMIAGTAESESESATFLVGNLGESADQAARFLKSIAHKDRLKILCYILERERSVAEIEGNVGASQSAISQHLARLKDEGIVAARRNGRQIFYSISDPVVLEVIKVLYVRFCDAGGSMPNSSDDLCR